MFPNPLTLPFLTCPPVVLRSDRTQAVLTALDNKLGAIDAADQQSKQDAVAYEQHRQNTVNEILSQNSNNNPNNIKSSNTGGGGGGKFFRLGGSLANMPTTLNTSGDYYSGIGGSMTMDDAMDLDEPVPSSPSKKKPSGPSPTSTTAPRKRVRGGQ